MGKQLEEVIRVGMAQTEVAQAPKTLATFGLGSCVGVTAWDPISKVGGLAHIMLPDSTQARSKENVAKFADTAMPDLIGRLEKIGGVRRRLVIKIAGGAKMFDLFNDDRFAIGRRNVEAVKQSLEKLNLRISAEDTGGNFGRTLFFDVENGTVIVRTIDHGEKQL